ncbi:MAG: hypothetical protein Q8P28_04040 [Deltaproteobacteria bacterium]|nr:hypothetical protein [Deltaproteobacteria bacterium]
MKDEIILPLLEEAAEKLTIKVSYDDLRKGEVNTPGGSFVLKGERRIIIHKKLYTGEKVDILMELLSEMDFEGIHLPVEIRERLDRIKAKNKNSSVSVQEPDSETS